MKKENRIKKNKEFQMVFHQGKSYANRQFVVYALKREDTKHFRIGLSVSKKIGNAVIRNKIKRYIRQAFQELEDRVYNNYDYVVIARKPVVHMEYSEVLKSLIHVLRVARVFKQSRKGDNEIR